MEREIANLLRSRAEEVAEMYSHTDRAKNYANETFTVRKITVLSETTACVVYDKAPTGKVAVAWFYYVAAGQPRWEYFFVTYSHLVGLNKVADFLHRAEQHNFSLRSEEEQQ